MTPLASSHPYDELTPDVIFNALEHIGLKVDGRLTALNSYENRVYLVHLETGKQLVVKFYRPHRWTPRQIAEEHAFAQQLAQAEIPVVAPLTVQATTLHAYHGFLFAVYPRMGGRYPELDDPFVLEWIGRFLGRIHVVGQKEDFTERPALDAASFGFTSRDWLLQHGVLPIELQPQWLNACDSALSLVQQVWASMDNMSIFRLHGDCHPGNILWRPAQKEDPGGPHFVDLDDARMGPAVQDFWMLLSQDRQERQQQLAHLMAGYEDFCVFDWQELKLIEPLRTLRIIHYSAWLARRWDDPAFPLAFPWFGTHNYWLEQIQTLQNQVERMQEM